MPKKASNTKAAKSGSDSKSAKKVSKAKKVTKTVSKKTEPVEVVAPAETVADDKSVSSAASTPGSELAEQFTDFMAKLQQVCAAMSALKSEFRALEKKATRELKAAQKSAAKKKRKSGNRQPSGFVKPTLISPALAAFLGKPEGTEMARTEVTREINGYIRQHKLQDKDNGRIIRPDSKLKSLLNIGAGEELTYFNLQKYMSPHFAKAGSTTFA
tara:strand:+ start:1652 stop:2293 length:642 start_codon:yes stop_codon:yes gene_type:complete